MKPNPEPVAKKPRVALLLATGFGLGYLPFAPGTWGALGGITLAWSLSRISPTGGSLDIFVAHSYFVVASFHLVLFLALALALAGIWAAGRAAKFLGTGDPQTVVIDEVSGQHMTLLLGLGSSATANWKYLLVGFILFRVFDIWKPFPVRQAERLPGGWGIMADDWVAALYAAVGLWLARSLGL